MPAFAIPFLPVLKIVALGSLKVVFLFLGACFVPRLTLRFVVGGSVGMIIPVLDWLRDQDRMTSDAHEQFARELQELNQRDYTRPEARKLLFKIVGKTLRNIKKNMFGIPATVAGWFKKKPR